MVDLLVLTSAKRELHEVALDQAQQILSDGRRCFVYLIHDAVAVADTYGWEERASEQCPLYLCAYNLEKRGLPFPDEAGVVLAGLGSLGQLIQHAGYERVETLIGDAVEAQEEGARVVSGLRHLSEVQVGDPKPVSEGTIRDDSDRGILRLRFE
ncbi:MAG: hypothetical protein AAFY98_09060 [Verrucomicrobiota bacterium]